MLGHYENMVCARYYKQKDYSAIIIAIVKI